MKKHVLVCTLVAALAVVFGAEVSAEETVWPLACRFASYGDFKEAAWEHLPSIGIHYVFLPVPPSDEVDAVMKRLKDSGLTPLVMRGDTDLSKGSCITELARQIVTCKKMGVKYMFLSPKRHGAAKEVVFERLRKAGNIAQQHGVTITLETHPDLGTNGDVHVETMKAINHSHIRVNYDTANITYYNKGADSVAELKKCIDYVATLEVKDHNCEFETWNFPVLGTGKVDFPAILEVLKKNNYTGPITLEFEGIKGVELNEDQTKQAIADSVAYIKSLATFK